MMSMVLSLLLTFVPFSKNLSQGASNNQLVKEQNPIAIKYHGKSPAENNSIDLAWSTLMKPDFKDLVKCICQTSADKDRLKKLVINAVLATDIFDESLKESRNMRWKHVFGENAANKETLLDENLDSLKVKIVLEHLIQASDVAHTMQHWHVYIKWVSDSIYLEDAFPRPCFT